MARGSAGRSALHALGERAGIIDEYVDQTGQERRRTNDETRVALLQAMELRASTEDEARDTLARLEADRNATLLDAVAVHRLDASRVAVALRTGAGRNRNVRWRAELVDEHGEARMFEGDARSRRGIAQIELPEGLSAGYYTLRVWLDAGADSRHAVQSLILAPQQAPSVRALTGRERLFGLVANLYTVRGSRDWGIGDLTVLAELAEWCAELGGALVGVNPLHVLRNSGMDISPYSPISRLYRNPIYLDVEAVPELADSSEARALIDRRDVRGMVEAARESARIDYELIAAAKRTVLEALYRTFVNTHRDADSARGRAYRAFLAERGDRLRAFATFMALNDHFGNEPGGWTAWPEPYRRPSSPEVTAFGEAHRPEVDFHAWVQFELERQLADAARRARDAGLPIGIYQDLAIGTAGWGSDVWAAPQLFANGVNIGAPPDSYSATGQDWGLPPLNPHRLRETGYSYWIALLRQAFASAGALRIDHIIGLFRQFWIPHGRSGKDGAYVRFPTDDLLGILVLEATRHRALVVGEDLGTVPPEVQPTLERWGVLSSKVLYFEREADGAYRSARAYPALALTTANTHDMAPLESFWEGSDIELRRNVGLIATDEEARAARRERAGDRHALLARLAEEGALTQPVAETDGSEVRAAVHRFLDTTPSVLVGISLDDVSGEREPINVPGIAQDRFSSWTRRMSRSLSELRADRKAVQIARCERRALR